jgi:hypothetical protein
LSIWSILYLFGIFFPVLACCTKTNLATLYIAFIAYIYRRDFHQKIMSWSDATVSLIDANWRREVVGRQVLPSSEQGCQIFLGTWYQNQKKCTKWAQNVPKCYR